MKNKIKITVVGAGYVGTSLGVLLARKNEVTFLDTDKEKIELIQRRKTHLRERKLIRLLKEKGLSINASNDYDSSLKSAQFIIVCTPTNFNEKNNYFDTSVVEHVIKQTLKINKSALIVIKSTVPVGFTESMQ